MKWLFMTLIGLNLIVFAGMIAGKMWKEYKPAPVAAASQQSPVQVIINPNELAGATAASSVKTVAGSTQPNTIKPPVVVQPPKNDKQPVVKVENTKNNNNNNNTVRPVAPPQANYKNCSARVSMPEDDYHRIKGLLGKYPHAASRQVVEGSAEDGAQSSSRMNVLFMSVSDQDAGAIQAVVGRYGQLHRAPCNK